MLWNYVLVIVISFCKLYAIIYLRTLSFILICFFFIFSLLIFLTFCHPISHFLSLSLPLFFGFTTLWSILDSLFSLWFICRSLFFLFNFVSHSLLYLDFFHNLLFPRSLCFLSLLLYYLSLFFSFCDENKFIGSQFLSLFLPWHTF